MSTYIEAHVDAFCNRVRVTSVRRVLSQWSRLSRFDPADTSQQGRKFFVYFPNASVCERRRWEDVTSDLETHPGGLAD